MDEAVRLRVASIPGSSLVFREDVIRANRQAVEDELTNSLASAPGPTAAHRITAWAMTVRQPAFTFTSVLHTHPDVTEAAPHLGYRYADLMLQLPAAWLYRKAFYAYMIHLMLPELRHIAYANTGTVLSGRLPTLEVPVEPLARRTIGRAYSYGTRAVNRLMRTIQPARSARSLLFSDAALLDHVQDCVHSLAAVRDVVDVQRCDELLERTRAGLCPSEEALGSLTAFCVSAASLQDGAAATLHEWGGGRTAPQPS